jgi:Trypsin-co-occurring domain 1
MESRTTIVPVLLPNGKEIRVEATLLPGEEEVSFKALPAEEIFDAVEGIAQAVVTTLQKVKPRKATVELGLEVGLESGHLTALLVKGTGTANLKLTLEWGGK